MKLKIFAAVITALLAFSSPGQSAEKVTIKVGYMLLLPSGTFAAIANGTGSQINMDGDLNFYNSGQVTAELSIKQGNSLFSLGIIPIKFGGAGTLQRTLEYNGQNFVAGTVTQSSLQANIFDLGYSYNLLNNDTPSRLQLGLEATAKIINVKTNLSSGGTATSNKSATVVIPTVGLRGNIAVTEFIGLNGRVGYLGYAGNTFTDFDTQIEFSPQPRVGVYAGYRYLKMKLDSKGVLADVTFRGPYAGAFLRF